jgi:hypothetical protein
MGNETDKLVATVKAADGAVTEWIGSFDSAMKTLNAAIARVTAVATHTASNRQSMVTERTFTNNALNMIEINVKKLEKGLKDLGAKVSKKEVINIVKEQKSLEAAKKAQTDGAKTLAEGKKAYTEDKKLFDAASKKVDALLALGIPPTNYEQCYGAYKAKWATWVASQHCSENLEFVLLWRGGKLNAANGLKVYNAYVKAGSPKEINIANSLRAKFDECLPGNTWADAPWDAAGKELDMLLEQGTYKDWRGSKDFNL